MLSAFLSLAHFKFLPILLEKNTLVLLWYVIVYTNLHKRCTCIFRLLDPHMPHTVDKVYGSNNVYKLIRTQLYFNAAFVFSEKTKVKFPVLNM